MLGLRPALDKRFKAWRQVPREVYERLLTDEDAPVVGEEVNRLIKKAFAIDVPVLVRSQRELAQVVRRNPLQKVAVDPKRYLVTFMSAELSKAVVQRMRAVAGPQEDFSVIGRQVYSWHPAGVGRSPLWERLAGKALGITASRLKTLGLVDKIVSEPLGGAHRGRLFGMVQ